MNSTSTADKRKQRCTCGRNRMPKYSSDKSWAKHLEFCTDPPDSFLQKKPCKYFASGRCRDGDRCKFSHELRATKRKAEGPPRPSPGGSIDDIPRLLDGIRAKLDGFEFTRVQLGVFDDERVVLDEAQAKRSCHGEPAVAAKEDTVKGPAVAAKEDTVKGRVLEKLRLEFLRLWPDAEVVHQQPDLKVDFDMAQWSFREPIHTAVLLYARYRKLVRDIPQTRWPCAKCSQEKTGQKGKSGKSSKPRCSGEATQEESTQEVASQQEGCTTAVVCDACQA